MVYPSVVVVRSGGGDGGDGGDSGSCIGGSGGSNRRRPKGSRSTGKLVAAVLVLVDVVVLAVVSLVRVEEEVS